MAPTLDAKLRKVSFGTAITASICAAAGLGWVAYMVEVFSGGALIADTALLVLVSGAALCCVLRWQQAQVSLFDDGTKARYWQAAQLAVQAGMVVLLALVATRNADTLVGTLGSCLLLTAYMGWSITKIQKPGKQLKNGQENSATTVIDPQVKLALESLIAEAVQSQQQAQATAAFPIINEQPVAQPAYAPQGPVSPQEPVNPPDEAPVEGGVFSRALSRAQEVTDWNRFEKDVDDYSKKSAKKDKPKVSQGKMTQILKDADPKHLYAQTMRLEDHNLAAWCEGFGESLPEGSPEEAKRKLARTLVLRFHSQEVLDDAEQAYEAEHPAS